MHASALALILAHLPADTLVLCQGHSFDSQPWTDGSGYAEGNSTAALSRTVILLSLLLGHWALERGTQI